jgi:hypothetical protein
MPFSGANGAKRAGNDSSTTKSAENTEIKNEFFVFFVFSAVELIANHK